MDVPCLVLTSGRRLILLSLDQAPSTLVGCPFATLLPAFDDAERRQAEAMVDMLIDRGSVEFCCVGPESELLHDSIDDAIERRGALDVVTTWHTDYLDASDYFLFAAGGRSPTLLALVASHPDLVTVLENGARNE